MRQKLMGMSVDELRRKLRDEHKCSGGKKSELVDRLLSSLLAEADAVPAARAVGEGTDASEPRPDSNADGDQRGVDSGAVEMPARAPSTTHSPPAANEASSAAPPSACLPDLVPRGIVQPDSVMPQQMLCGQGLAEQAKEDAPPSRNSVSEGSEYVSENLKAGTMLEKRTRHQR